MAGVGYLYRAIADQPLFKYNVAPYLPGAKQIQQMEDERRFWDDYYKNTGFRPRYPGRQIHGADAEDVLSGLEWWK